MNGQVAARLVTPLGAWRRHDAGRAALMREQIQRILGAEGLSRFTYEKVTTVLGSGAGGLS